MLAALGEVFCAQVPRAEFVQVCGSDLGELVEQLGQGFSFLLLDMAEAAKWIEGFGLAKLQDGLGAGLPVGAVGVEQVGDYVDGSPGILAFAGKGPRVGEIAKKCVEGGWGAGEKGDAVLQVEVHRGLGSCLIVVCRSDGAGFVLPTLAAECASRIGHPRSDLSFKETSAAGGAPMMRTLGGGTLVESLVKMGAVVALAMCGLLAARIWAQEKRTPTEDGIVYGEADGQTLTMDYYAPKGPLVHGETLHPIAIIIHGGGYHGGDAKSGSEAYVADFLAPAGYAVFSVNYRLAPKYPYPYMVLDVQRAVRFIRHNAQNGMPIQTRLRWWAGRRGDF
jgi:hypothetical protein